MLKGVCLKVFAITFLFYFYFIFIFIYFYHIIFNTFFHNWVAVCWCFRGRSLNFTTNLYVNFISIHIPTLTYTTFLFTHWSRDCSSVEWEPTFMGFHISTPKKATKVASETTDLYTWYKIFLYTGEALKCLTCSSHLRFSIVCSCH